MKIFPSRLPTWLSEIVQAESQRQHPQLASPSLLQRATKLLMLFPLSTAIAVVIWSTVTLLNELLVSKGWAIATYDLSSGNAADILSSTLEYMAALIGVAVPVIFLIVEFLARDFSSVIDVYLDETGIKRTTMLAFTIFGLEAIGIWLLRTGILKSPKTLFYLTLLLTMLSLSVLFETGRTVWLVRQTISSHFLSHALVTKLKSDIRESQRTEIRYRLSRLANINLISELNLVRLRSLNSPRDFLPLRSSTSGVIQDVHLTRFAQFVEELQTRIGGHPKAYVRMLVGDYVSEGEPLVYIPSEEGERVEELQYKLERSLRIGSPSRKENEIERLLTQVREMVRTAIREENETLFNEFVDIYWEVFSLGMNLPLPPSPDLVVRPFQGWRVSATAIHHLHNLVEQAARSENDLFIRGLAYRLSDIAQAMIQQSESGLDNSFRDILDLFVVIYHHSHEHNNVLGVNRSFHYLTQNLVDHTWMVKLNSVQQNLDAVVNLRNALRLILGTIARLLKKMLDNYDISSIQELVQRAQPTELLLRMGLINRIPPHLLGNLSVRTRQLQAPDEQREPERKQQAVTLIQKLPDEVEGWFVEMIFVACSYTVANSRKSDLDRFQAKKILEVMRPYLLSFERHLALFHHLVNAPPGSRWSLFDRLPDTELAAWSDDSGKYYLFYCLRGIELHSLGQIPDRLPTIQLEEYQLHQIEETCGQILARSEEWSDILILDSHDLAELIEEFVITNRKIAKQWQEKREDQIIEAVLDPGKIALFAQSVRDEQAENSCLQRLLSHYGRVQRSASVKRATTWGGSSGKTPKEYFSVVHEGTQYVQMLGAKFGRALASNEDDYIVNRWLSQASSLRTRQDWETLAPYFRRALDRLEETGHQAKLILVPSNLKHESFTRTPGFVSQYEIDNEVDFLGVRGYFDEIPIIQWHFSQRPLYILVLDVARATQLYVEDLKTEVRVFSEEERDRIQTDNPEISDRRIQLCIVVSALQRGRLDVLDKDAILKLKLKFPEEAYYPS